MSEATPKLARLLETWQAETDNRLAGQAQDQKMAAAMFGRLVGMGVDDLRTAGRASQAFLELLKDMERIEGRDKPKIKG